MLITVDKRGSINLPASIRNSLGIRPGTHLELIVEPGGAITLSPVEIYRAIRLSDSGKLKLKEARESTDTSFPDWLHEAIKNAGADTE